MSEPATAGGTTREDRGLTGETALAGGSPDARGTAVRGVDRTDVALERVLVALDFKAYGYVIYKARSVISHLNELPPAEVRRVVNRLAELGRAPDLVELISAPELRAFLAKNEVPWGYVQAYWEPGALDTAQFFAGFVGGALENAIEGVYFLAYLLSAAPIQKLAEVAGKLGVLEPETAARIIDDRAEFFAGLQRFFADPLPHLEAGFRQYVAKIEAAAWNLDMIQMGRLTGHAVVMLLTWPTAVRALWKVVRLGQKLLTVALPRLLEAVPIAELEKAVLAGFWRRPSYVTGNGYVLAAVGDDVTVLAGDGRPVGQIALSEILEKVGRGGKGGRGSGSKPPLSNLQKRYAHRAGVAYPDKIWAYIDLLEKRFPKLTEKFGLRPLRRPRTGSPWVFEERMSADQDFFSFEARLHGDKIQLDDITPDGLVRDVKFRTSHPDNLFGPDLAEAVEGAFREGRDLSEVIEISRRTFGNAALRRFDDAVFDIIDQMNRQVEFVKQTGLTGVLWETNSVAWRNFLEQVMAEHGLLGKVMLQVKF
jgi:hypothetical protein